MVRKKVSRKDVAPGAAHVRPNTDYFAAMLESMTLESIAIECNTSVNTMRSILAGERKFASTMQRIAIQLDVPIEEIIVSDASTMLPGETAFYESLKFGYFIDHDRPKSGKPRWCRERLSIVHEPKLGDVFGAHFSGKIVHRSKQVFEIRCLLSNRFHFSIDGVHVRGQNRFSFTASFNQVVDGVLCGVWSGVNPINYVPSLYRMFVSKSALAPKDLLSLSKRSPIQLHLKGDFATRIRRN